MSRLNHIVSKNVGRAIKAAGNPSLYQISGKMVEFMERQEGPGREKYGPIVGHEAARKHITRALGSPEEQCWRLDYLEAIARVLDVRVVDLIGKR